MTPRNGPESESPALLDAIASLCEVLWQERGLLEAVQFRIEEQLCLLRSNQTRWIRLADEDVRSAVLALKDCEVLRAMEAQTVATTIGLSADATLMELAAASPEPWASMLLDHHRALAAISAGARQAVAQTRTLIRDESGMSTGAALTAGGESAG